MIGSKRRTRNEFPRLARADDACGWKLGPTDDRDPKGGKARNYRLPLEDCYLPAEEFASRGHGITDRVTLDCDGDGEQDTVVMVAWTIDGADVVPRVTTIRPMEGRATRYDAATHEPVAFDKSREAMACPRARRAV